LEKNPNIIPLNAFVGFNKNDGLDSILSETPIPRDFDFCSIDIDGNDYHVWAAIEIYRPKLICIEYNPTIPTECSFVQAADPALKQGASLLALVELGKSKGYELASVLPWNAFFVRSDFFPMLEIEDNSPQKLRTDLRLVTHFFYGYDGTVILRGNQTMHWHGLPIAETRVQLLPRILRKYPQDCNAIERFVLRIYRRVHLALNGVRFRNRV